MSITEVQKLDFRRAEFCHICSGAFTLEDVKVRDHNHLTGEFRGAAHNKCNLNFQDSRTIPVIMHNLTGYDSHFIIRELTNCFEGELYVIPSTDQNYISFTKKVAYTSQFEPNFQKRMRNTIKFKFLDSFCFMVSSLEKLASFLPSTRKIILHSEFKFLSPEKMHLLERKGIFPYDFVDSWEKLSYETLVIPPRQITILLKLFGRHSI